MNILFYLTRYPGVGGIETVTSQIIEQLTLKGDTIDVISHWQQEQLGGDICSQHLSYAKRQAMVGARKYHICLRCRGKWALRYYHISRQLRTHRNNSVSFKQRV